MELTVIICTLCVCFFILLTPCAAAMQIQEQEHPSPSQKQAREEIKFSLPEVLLLPRKLRLLGEVAVKGGYRGPSSTTSYEKQKGDLSAGKSQHKNKEENALHGSKPGAGTWHEWVERTDASQFFTMDYAHVRRRRPIHNKSVPVGP